MDATTVMVTHLGEVIREHSHELLGRQEVKKMIRCFKGQVKCRGRIADTQSAFLGRSAEYT